MRQIEIAGRVINDESDVYVIAEIGGNHGGSLEVCKQMFEAAKDAGASAVKLQKRDNKTLYTKTFFNKPYDNQNSYGKTYGEHREFLEFTPMQYDILIEYAKEIGITFFATAFDKHSAEQLSFMPMPAYKIASADITNLPLISHIAMPSFGNKPLIISTGGATVEDIDRVYLLLKDKVPFSFLHCVATYPNQPEDLNLRCIEQMRLRYPEIVIGFSSHHPSVYMSLAAANLGASIIEVHFSLNRASKGTDHGLSLEPKGLATLCSDLKSIKRAMGNGEKEVLDAEKAPIEKMGKGIYPAREIRQGDTILSRDLALKSPGGGLKPYDLERVEGATALFNLSSSSPIKEGDVE